MINALFVTSEKTGLSRLENFFKNSDVNTFRSETGNIALSIISDTVFDLVVIDENLPDMTGLQLAAQLITKNPMINCALISSLSPEDYHEKSEGLGLIMQLPPDPKEEDGEELLNKLNTILNLTKRVD